MAFASHLGPWLLGTVKNTTGSTAGLIRNMGATIVGQSKAVAYTDSAASTAVVIPAGALITDISFITTTTFTAASTITLSIGATAISTASTITTAGVASVAAAATTAAAALWANVGSTDAILTYTLSVGASSAGAGTLVVSYIVRESNGAANPASV